MPTFDEKIYEGSLSLTEWESLDVGAEDYEPLRAAFSPAVGKRFEAIDVYDFYGPKLKAKSLVGAGAFEPPILVADGRVLRQIIVTPKIVRERQDGSCEWANFLKMFEVAYGVKLPDLYKDKPELYAVNDLRILFAWLYVAEVERLLEKHLRRSYIVRVDRLNSRIKGKLLLGAYVRESVSRCRPEVAICQFYELTPDTLLNRIVKAGLAAAKRLVHGAVGLGRWPELTGKLNRTAALMTSVSEVRVTATDFARVHFHAQNRYYKPAFELARMLIFQNCYDYDLGPRYVRGFFIDMNDLFERFVAGLLKRYYDSVYYPGITGELRYSTLKTWPTGGSITLKPDITVDSSDGRIFVDAKYKELFDEAYDAELLDTGDDYGGVAVKPRVADIYQINTYLDNIPSRAGVLVYPRTGGGYNVIRIEGCGEKYIFLVGLGLSNIDKLKETDWLGAIPVLPETPFTPEPVAVRH